jgi:hypothetical protein
MIPMRRECGPEEEIARAITSAHYDGERISSALFKGHDISVSRLAILPLSEIMVVFDHQLTKPDSDPPIKLLGAGLIDVGVLQDIGRNHISPVSLTVEIDPLPENPAHAVVPQKINRTLAKKIIDGLNYRWISP